MALQFGDAIHRGFKFNDAPEEPAVSMYEDSNEGLVQHHEDSNMEDQSTASDNHNDDDDDEVFSNYPESIREILQDESHDDLWKFYEIYKESHNYSYRFTKDLDYAIYAHTRRRLATNGNIKSIPLRYFQSPLDTTEYPDYENQHKYTLHLSKIEKTREHLETFSRCLAEELRVRTQSTEKALRDGTATPMELDAKHRQWTGSSRYPGVHPMFRRGDWLELIDQEQYHVPFAFGQVVDICHELQYVLMQLWTNDATPYTDMVMINSSSSEGIEFALLAAYSEDIRNNPRSCYPPARGTVYPDDAVSTFDFEEDEDLTDLTREKEPERRVHLNETMMVMDKMLRYREYAVTPKSKRRKRTSSRRRK